MGAFCRDVPHTERVAAGGGRLRGLAAGAEKGIFSMFSFAHLRVDSMDCGDRIKAPTLDDMKSTQ